jgi:spore coat protein CotH
MEEPSGYDFVKNTLNELEAALFNGSVPDAAYRDLIDMDVFIDYIMINEITRNVDVQKPHSVFLYRDGKKDSRIGLGPLWDFDWGFDYADSRYFVNTAGMFYNTVFREGPGQRFFSRFFDDPGFRTAYKNRWNEKYQEIIDMEQFIDEMVVLLGKSQEANSKVWWWKKVDYAKEIERMKQWWKDRTAYLHTEINTF